MLFIAPHRLQDMMLAKMSLLGVARATIFALWLCDQSASSPTMSRETLTAILQSGGLSTV